MFHSEASEDSKARENKKALSAQRNTLMWARKPTSYTYLLIGEKAKDGETYGFYNNSNGEWY